VGEEYRSWSSSLWSFIHFLFNSSFSDIKLYGKWKIKFTLPVKIQGESSSLDTAESEYDNQIDLSLYRRDIWHFIMEIWSGRQILSLSSPNSTLNLGHFAGHWPPQPVLATCYYPSRETFDFIPSPAPQISHPLSHFLLTRLRKWNRQGVLKRRQLNFIRQRTFQKKTYDKYSAVYQTDRLNCVTAVKCQHV
jgi:hypothetical protein